FLAVESSTALKAVAVEDCFARLARPASSIRTWPELRAQLKHMGKVPRGWWFGGFQLCSFLSPKMVRSAQRGPSIPAPRSRPPAQPVATRSLAVEEVGD